MKSKNGLNNNLTCFFIYKSNIKWYNIVMLSLLLQGGKHMLDYKKAREKGIKTSNINELYFTLKNFYPVLTSNTFDLLIKKLGEDELKKTIKRGEIEEIGIELENVTKLMNESKVEFCSDETKWVVGITTLALYATVASTIALTLILNR